MLAATALLKSHSPPKTPRASANRSRTIPRTTGYGSEKAIQAVHKTKSEALVEDIIPESQKRSLSQAEESTLLPEQLTTIELRLNEGNNLNRRKVQKIVGGSIKRKPVYFQGQPARQSPIDDCRGSCSQVDGQPETPQASGFTYIRDPFEDEANFDEDLVDGVLCECPTGSSTPKSAALTPQLNRVDEEEDYSFQNPRIGPETVDAKSRNNSLDIFSPAMEAPVVETIPAEHRVKKHPSPSKKALEDLEAAFAMYTKLKPLEDGDKTDELAKENRDALSVADGNKLMRQSWSKCDGSEASRHTSQRVARRIRHSLPYRTTLASSQDIDDLRN
ncbi:hypothetical protein CCM_00939 [Cordyceps militaris CM01]|uniref:Uncharacterized protein n=1 Tax=Cordyceps militaris (strain CM01) TaxID=983644 RepID=G3J7B3_CORMM|nr:uncharacterized protein CCM_00939 [Cordyceps militaris CM01]EGX96283.1 hypothetical protein CCM_00939 [Cordyceps militaris CM01]